MAFGSLFDSITITRENETGAETYRQQVPLEYGPKERWLTRLTEDPEFLRGVAPVELGEERVGRGVHGGALDARAGVRRGFFKSPRRGARFRHAACDLSQQCAAGASHSSSSESAPKFSQ